MAFAHNTSTYYTIKDYRRKVSVAEDEEKL